MILFRYAVPDCVRWSGSAGAQGLRARITTESSGDWPNTAHFFITKSRFATKHRPPAISIVLREVKIICRREGYAYLSVCFGTGREHKLNLLRRLYGARGSKWMSGSATMQEPSAERHMCAAKDPDQIDSALPRARPETSGFSVDRIGSSLWADDPHGERDVIVFSFLLEPRHRS